MPARKPEEVDQLLFEALNSGDLGAAIALYEPEATLIPQPGQVAKGTEAIRQALAAFLALKPRFSGEARTVAEAGDIALTSATWNMAGSGPDGGSITLSGRSAEVVRRQADGTWRFVIDNPYGME